MLIVPVFCSYHGVFTTKGCFSVEYSILSNNLKM
ncbi:aldo/keto reductase, partial [Salmonella enterica]|nr:aldo/keto reductase [Salmonella enterica]